MAARACSCNGMSHFRSCYCPSPMAENLSAHGFYFVFGARNFLLRIYTALTFSRVQPIALSYIISNSMGTFLGFGPSGVNIMSQESTSGLPMMSSVSFLRFSATSNTAPPGTLTP